LPGAGRGVMGSYCLKSIEFEFWKIKISGDDWHKLKIFNTAEF
jgi:hypothetical protein